MPTTTLPGGTLTLAEDLTVTRMGYGAMQLAGPHVFGPPADRDAAVAVLREAVQLGITHIDTSDYYGPYVTNQIIREALHPYPDGLHIVTKVGAFRDAEGGWPQALAPEQLRQAVQNNLDHLGLDALDVVNLRVGGFESPTPGSIAEPFTALAEMQREGWIRHLGISTVNAEQVAEAQSIAPVVCVQNFYNLELLDLLDRENGLLDDPRFGAALDHLSEDERVRILRPHLVLHRSFVWPLKIKEAAQVLGDVTEHQLRDWDDAGICRAARWGKGRYRGYFRSQLLLARLIRTALARGYGVERLREDLGLAEKPIAARDLVAVVRAVTGDHEALSA